MEIDKDVCNEPGEYVPVEENNDVKWEEARYFQLGDLFPQDGREWILSAVVIPKKAPNS